MLAEGIHNEGATGKQGGLQKGLQGACRLWAKPMPREQGREGAGGKMAKLHARGKGSLYKIGGMVWRGWEGQQLCISCRGGRAGAGTAATAAEQAAVGAAGAAAGSVAGAGAQVQLQDVDAPGLHRQHKAACCSRQAVHGGALGGNLQQRGFPAMRV